MLGPVHIGFEVMADVVAVVPAFYIVLGIDAGSAVLVGIGRVEGVDEGMLGPIAGHGDNAEGKERKNEHDKCCRPTDEAQTDTQGDKQQFSPHRPIQQLLPVLTNEVGTQIDDAQRNKSAKVN